MDQEIEQTPEADDPVGEARGVYQEYVDFWEVDPSPASQSQQEKLTNIITKIHGPEHQAETALSWAKDFAAGGSSYPTVFCLGLTGLDEKDRWQILAESIAKEAEKSATQGDETKAEGLRKKAEALRKGIAALE